MSLMSTLLRIQGEVIELTHTYVFLPSEEVEHIPQETFKTENIFSKNGILEPTM
ncbi:hypothetical protein KUL118_64090 [Tenacibaculum sp. KUL118]|nr:hypothetical protein KUL118_64090 [Tenacibaculum sp. KUL118]